MNSSRVSRLVALSAASRRQRAASRRHSLGSPIIAPDLLQAGVLKLSATGACSCCAGDSPRMRPSKADSQLYSRVLFELRTKVCKMSLVGHEKREGSPHE